MTYGDKGNPNKVVLTWSRTTDGFRNTKEDEAKVYAYGIDLTKVLSEGGTDFKAVQFTLQNKSNQTGTFYLEAEKAEDGIYYITGNTTKESDATKFSPDDKGKLLIYGLEEDSYVLTEVQTASGTDRQRLHPPEGQHRDRGKDRLHPRRQVRRIDRQC